MIYEDVSLERGAFLVQQAMRVGFVISIEFCQPSNIVSFVSGLKLSCFISSDGWSIHRHSGLIM